ncbi:hypothetical protein NQ318_019996 [Aromia moschata]|uniref:XRN2-binding (XTBD) domain-containing protein n=1 Tax=Aromia moschata TaxID=1265417 RepID=A0AAV8Y5I8_9CUCU|nr:hypothetical protein NQ318_019996 [Aromia moschata]
MTVHKGKFSEEYLVALAKTFTNIEFLGCTYPAPLMKKGIQILVPTHRRVPQWTHLIVRASVSVDSSCFASAVCYRRSGKGTVADPRSKCNFVSFSCCSRIFVICSMVQPLPKARNFPEWKSANRPNRALSMCRTSGTWDIKEWCRISVLLFSACVKCK